MSCCGGDLSACAAGPVSEAGDRAILRAQEADRAARLLPDGAVQYVLGVPDVHCAACIRSIEQTLSTVAGVRDARVNFTTRRVTVTTAPGADLSLDIVRALSGIGYPPTPLDIANESAPEARESRELLKALAVAGFAAGNVMLLSVSVWSGAEGATRDLFHLVSALIAIPAVGYAGRPFFRSAWRALRVRKVNMDVPISLGVLLATAMSVYETFAGAHHAWFDASLTLLFFLLVGRYLDHLMRERAGAAVARLSRLAARGAAVMGADGRVQFTPIDEVLPGMRISVALGERVPVDGIIADGISDFDRSIVTGESAPESLGRGAEVLAGDLNLTAPVVVEARVRGRETFLAEMVRMMEQAETTRARYRRIADRFAESYAPAVHLLAAATFIGWMIWTGGDWHASVMAAVAVLIITCPCALGLAVPVVQVVGSGVLLEKGILVRSGSAFERMAEADCVVFDKTGTLTDGLPELLDAPRIDRLLLASAAALASSSRHPFSAAILRAADRHDVTPRIATDVQEHPGFGVEGRVNGRRARLGRPDWVGAIASGGTAGGSVAFAVEGEPLAGFRFRDRLREGAVDTVATLRRSGVGVEILSGDRAEAVNAVGSTLGIGSDAIRSDVRPEDKIARIAELAAAGHRPLMVGDGINDAPALAAAHVSMAPGSASDIGRTASDFVFLRPDLKAVTEARHVSTRVLQLVRQNFALALGYNALAVPIAVFGYATPLIAAVAMSTSSLIVVLNALRLRLEMRPRKIAAVNRTSLSGMTRLEPAE